MASLAFYLGIFSPAIFVQGGATEGGPVVDDEMGQLRSAILSLETQISEDRMKIETLEKNIDARESELRQRKEKEESVPEAEYNNLGKDKGRLEAKEQQLAAKEQQLAEMRREKNILLERQKPTPDAGRLYPRLKSSNNPAHSSSYLGRVCHLFNVPISLYSLLVLFHCTLPPDVYQFFLCQLVCVLMLCLYLVYQPLI